MIALFFALILVNSLYCIGVYKACSFEYKSDDHPELGVIEGSQMIGWRLRLYAEKYLGRFASKPLFSCPPCMASVHSTYVFWPLVLTMYGFHPIEALIYIVYVGALCTVNWILIELIER